MNKLRIIGLGLTLILGAGACTTKEKSAAEKPARPKEEYVRRTPTGTWISKKVPKSQAQTSEEETSGAQQAMGELQRRGNRTPKETGN